MISFALLAASVLLQANGAPASNPRDVALVERTLDAERKFFDGWQRAWATAERNRASETRQVDVDAQRKGGNYNPRQADVNCYFNWDAPLTYVPETAWGRDPMDRKIGSRKNQHHWVCPNWLPPEGFRVATPRTPDERLGIDGALEVDDRLRLQPQRRLLIAQLEVAVRQAPHNNVLVGQLIRLLVDDGSMDRAVRAARSCDADQWWCLVLAGYAYHRSGKIAEADDAFAKSVTLMPTGDRCVWTDLSSIMSGTARYEYSHQSCAERGPLTDAVWWLADPLWSVRGNDRRTEQFARLTTVVLHSATGRDERYNWMPEGGGDALAEMVMRYGWPSYTYTGYGAQRINFGPPKPPEYGFVILYKPKPKTPPIFTADLKARSLGGIKSTYEYSVGRLHVIPEWQMILHPFDIRLTDWSMNGPGGLSDEALKWWPQEHYAPLHPLMGIGDQQTAFLRRQDTTLLAYATNLGQTDLARRMGDSVDAALVTSTGPQSVLQVATKRVEAHDRLTFLAPLPTGSSMVSAEIKWDSAGHRGARARFGVTPTYPLARMSRDDYAISDPVLLIVPPDMDELPNLADSAIALMRGSTTLSVGTNAIGVYWETYGFSATDSVEIAVSVQRHSGNVLERAAAAVGVAGDANSLVTVSWKEPQPGHSARTIGGPVPIQMRSVVLKIPSVTPGEYTLEVSARKPGGVEVKGKREFVLR
jgi:hypothetical protein